MGSVILYSIMRISKKPNNSFLMEPDWLVCNDPVANITVAGSVLKSSDASE